MMPKFWDRATADRDWGLDYNEPKVPHAGRKMTDVEAFEADDIMADVILALERSVAKHAPMHSPHEGHSVIREEFEELWEHVKADTGHTREAYREALQLAAMAVRYALDLIPKENRRP